MSEAIWETLSFGEKNAVIEASAGTGKTFTLEHIVEELVVHRGYDIQQILLVTFTEKAAGELKDRIRKILASVKPDARIDEATIGTIHSFCRQVLAEYPFESGVSVGAEIGGSDDSLLYRQAVQNVIRSIDFENGVGNDFDKLMERWGAGKEASAKKKSRGRYTVKLDGLVSAVVERLKKAGVKETIPSFAEEEKKWRTALEDAIQALPTLDGRPLSAGAYVLQHTAGGATLGTAKYNERYRPFFVGLDEQLKLLKTEGCGEEREIAALQFISVAKVDFKLQQWDGQKLKSQTFCEFNELAPFGDLQNAASQLADLLQNRIVHELASRAQAEFRRLKARSNALTFDDLVQKTANLVEAASRASEADARHKFIDKMRDRYRLALVDEFQDTDPAQWKIFKTLFGDVNHLIVVGDPKQAIYSFRGADLATYLTAKDEIVKGGGELRSLDTMYRSTREMVDDFNTMFKTEGWFTDMSEGDLAIEYSPVKFPASDAPKAVAAFKYPEGEHAVEWLEAGAGLRQFLENAANEMIRLHQDSKWGAHMEWDKMCVLVRYRRDAALARDILRAKHIPCRIYKEPGIFDSEEAESILAVFDYLAMPRSDGNLAALLLTPLFGVEPENLAERLSKGDVAFDRLCDKWRAMSEKRNWIGLFESIMRETKARLAPAGYRQVLDQLLTDYGRATSLAELASALRRLQSADVSAGEDGNVRNRADETPAVQIMTMHAAKGLEFNAVFVAAGFEGVKSNIPKDEKERQISEAKRLFYVTLTRAALRLYLPWSQNPWEKEILKKSSALANYLGEAIRVVCGDDVATRFRDPGEMKFVEGQKQEQKASQPQGERAPRLGLKGWRFKWDSFSSMNHHGASARPEVEELRTVDDEGDESQETVAEEAAAKPSLVPKGALSGTAFHEVMEILCNSDGRDGRIGFEVGREDDFEKVVAETKDVKSPLLEIVRRRLAKNGIANRANDAGESTARSLAHMAWVALRTPLRFGDDVFRLCEIARADRKAEVEFVIDEGMLLAKDAPREGALNGSIDLLVRRPNGYVIIDWKTNALDDYESATVAEAMDLAGYHLQYRIYTLAAEKWLGGACVKGAAYLFVRGGELGEASGVFAHEATDAERAEFSEKLAARLNESDEAEEKEVR